VLIGPCLSFLIAEPPAVTRRDESRPASVQPKRY